MDYYSYKSSARLTFAHLFYNISSTCDVSTNDSYSNWKRFQSLVLWLKRGIRFLKMCNGLCYHSINIVIIF